MSRGLMYLIGKLFNSSKTKKTAVATRVAVNIQPSDQERATLERWPRSRRSEVRLRERAQPITLKS